MKPPVKQHKRMLTRERARPGANIELHYKFADLHLVQFRIMNIQGILSVGQGISQCAIVAFVLCNGNLCLLFDGTRYGQLVMERRVQGMILRSWTVFASPCWHALTGCVVLQVLLSQLNPGLTQLQHPVLENVPLCRKVFY